MRYKKIDSTYVIRLERGERISEKLLGFCEQERIKAGCFSGLGACSEVELGHFNFTGKNYSILNLSEQYEITSLHGNISTLEGKCYLHAHIVLGDQRFQSWSGHLREAVISATAEIFLVSLDGELARKKDPDTGLNLLDI
jgi:hypothetical protein